MQDAHFADYQEKLDALESDYLKKKITYADYLQKKKEIDEKYNKEVQERRNVVSSGY